MAYQALMVSHELIRVAILWHEQWHEGLEEASRLYFAEHNVDGMLATIIIIIIIILIGTSPSITSMACSRLSSRSTR